MLVRYLVEIHIWSFPSLDAPTCFQIKLHSQPLHGAANFYFLVCWFRELTNDRICDAFQKSLKRKRYFAHPESIPLVALNEPNISVRNISLSFTAESYYYHITGIWSSCIIAPSAKISSISEGELADAVELGVPMMTSPCHLQALERLVNDISMISVLMCLFTNDHMKCLCQVNCLRRNLNLIMNICFVKSLMTMNNNLTHIMVSTLAFACYSFSLGYIANRELHGNGYCGFPMVAAVITAVMGKIWPKSTVVLRWLILFMR